MTYFDTPIQEFVFYDKYSRFDNNKGRRETWPETVARTTNYLRELSDNKLSEEDYQEIHQAILSMKVAPSMRLLKTAGKAARKNPESLFNCAYLPIVSIDAITELLWISMCGVGVGYSVEKRYTNLLPKIKYQNPYLNHDHDMFFLIPDSAEGWVEALHLGLEQWMDGKDITFDYSQIRPAGTPLKTKGGTASGSQILIDLLLFVRKIILSRQGKRLRPIDIFDICTMVGSAAVSGGSRRSAQACLFDLDDKEMLNAKHGEFWQSHPNRTNANISPVIEKELSFEEVSSLMNIMFRNGTGEPGFASRLAANATKPTWRRPMPHGGQNACFEINLHGATSDGRFGGQFCNLSTINVYPSDTFQSLKEKARITTVIGTIQSMAVDFRNLRPTWKEICEEERLLGVSMIGVMDNSIAQDSIAQKELQEYVTRINIEYADKLGINRAAAITTIKPAGNSSVMYGTARGINARYAPYYIRRVRVNEHTPVFSVLRDSGIRLEPDVVSQNGTWVAEFYEKSPEQSVTIDNLSAIDQLEIWKSAKLNWAQHNVSVTIEYNPEEQQDIIDWVYKNQLILNGVAFLPRNNHVYVQAPYEKLYAQDYEDRLGYVARPDFSRLMLYESQDMTVSVPECSVVSCDI